MRRHFYCVLFLVYVLTPVQTLAVDPQIFEGVDGSWRIPKYCGPNALYAFLKLHGHDVSYNDVLKTTAPKENGVSMFDLKRSSESLGLPVLIQKSNPKSLQQKHFPVIAHMAEHSQGHFYVLLGIDETSVIVADPTTCTVKRMLLDSFKKDWSGYILTRPKTFWNSLSIYLFGIAFIILFASFFYAPVSHFPWPRKRLIK